MKNLKSLVKVLDLRADIKVYSDPGTIVFDGKVFELMNNNEDYMYDGIKDWNINGITNDLCVLLK